MLFFLSDRIYWIYWIFFSFSQFPVETEKEESRYAGEIKELDSAFLDCHNTHLWLDPGAFSCRLWRHWVFVLPSGKDKKTIKIVLILFILSNIKEDRLEFLSCITLKRSVGVMC